MITVQQLIEKLQTYPPDAHVCTTDQYGYKEILPDDILLIDAIFDINQMYFDFNSVYVEEKIKAVIL